MFLCVVKVIDSTEWLQWCGEVGIRESQMHHRQLLVWLWGSVWSQRLLQQMLLHSLLQSLFKAFAASTWPQGLLRDSSLSQRGCPTAARQNVFVECMLLDETLNFDPWFSRCSLQSYESPSSNVNCFLFHIILSACHHGTIHTFVSSL